MNDIDRIREILGPNGENWSKGFFHRGDGTHCLVGALSWATGSHCGKTVRVLQDVIWEQHGNGMTPALGTSILVLFNDSETTTWEDVDKVLDKASVRLDEDIST